MIYSRAYLHKFVLMLLSYNQIDFLDKIIIFYSIIQNDINNSRYLYGIICLNTAGELLFELDLGKYPNAYAIIDDGIIAALIDNNLVIIE